MHPRVCPAEHRHVDVLRGGRELRLEALGPVHVVVAVVGGGVGLGNVEAVKVQSELADVAVQLADLGGRVSRFESRQYIENP